MVVLAKPDPCDMVQAIKTAISILPNIDPEEMHSRMKKLYNWHDVAKRTEIVYDHALKYSKQNLSKRLSRYLMWIVGRKAFLLGHDHWLSVFGICCNGGSLLWRSKRCLTLFYPMIKMMETPRTL